MELTGLEFDKTLRHLREKKDKLGGRGEMGSFTSKYGESQALSPWNGGRHLILIMNALRNMSPSDSLHPCITSLTLRYLHASITIWSRRRIDNNT